MDKVKIGIVGMGQRACHHGGVLFGTCKESVRLSAICDNRPERLARGKKMYEEVFGDGIATYADYREMYEKSGVDAVFIAGPNYIHRDMTLAAFQHGLHVLCEKPMELSLAKCDEMIAAGKKAGRVLGMGMQMHYRTRYHKVREMIEQGMIGQPAMVWCTEYRGPFAEMKDWVWEKEKSGGAIVEKNCHHYDLLRLWVKSDPTTVYATGNILKHTTGSGRSSEIIDNAWIVNDYASGARGMVGICFLAGPQQPHYREFGVMGTEGKIFFTWEGNETIHVTLTNGATMTYDAGLGAELRGGMFADFVDCVRTGRQPLVTGEMARASLLVPMAAEKSIEEKRVVHVSELR